MKNFNALCEAYEVLSNSEFRGVYDKNGSEGLKSIGKRMSGKFTAGYAYQGNCFEIFEAFHGNSSPYTDNFDGQYKPPQENDASDPESPKDINVTLDCSIHEFYNGSIKIFKFKRDKFMQDMKSIEEVEEEMTVEVKPGMAIGTVLSFKSKGNCKYAYHQSYLRVTFALKDTPHNAVYCRKGDDLYYTHSLTLEDSLMSAPI